MVFVNVGKAVFGAPYFFAPRTLHFLFVRVVLIAVPERFVQGENDHD